MSDRFIIIMPNATARANYSISQKLRNEAFIMALKMAH